MVCGQLDLLEFERDWPVGYFNFFEGADLLVNLVLELPVCDISLSVSGC